MSDKICREFKFCKYYADGTIEVFGNESGTPRITGMSTFGHGRILQETIYHCVRCPYFKVQTIINPFKPLPGGCLKANILIYDAKWGDIPEQCPLPKEE